MRTVHDFPSHHRDPCDLVGHLTGELKRHARSVAVSGDKYVLAIECNLAFEVGK